MDRLTLPKRQPATEGGSSLNAMIQNPPPGVPPSPLPTWAALSYDSKLPMIPGPKGAVKLFTTKMGERIYRNPPELDFDLTDPYSIMYSNGYKVLHDPHLKTHLNAVPMQSRLHRGGFITQDGKVLCTLKEFNQYRRYLRKIKLALERKAEQEKSPVSKGKRSYQHGGFAEHARLREQKVREVRERLAKQQEEDRLRLERYLKMKQEEEDRRQRIRQDQSDHLSYKESELREKEQRRQFAIQRKQTEDRRHKLAMLRQWIEQDALRIERAEARRRAKEAERQRKLEDSWEQRKRNQEDRLREEMRRREIAREAAGKRINEREKVVRMRWEGQQARLKKMTDLYRGEREELQEEHANKFAHKIAQIHAENARKRRERRRPKKKGVSKKSRPTSIWTIQKTIMQSLSEDEGAYRRFGDGDAESRRASFLNIMVEEVRRGASVEKAVEKSIGDLGLGDYKGATFNGGVGATGSHQGIGQQDSLHECSSGLTKAGASDVSVRFTDDVHAKLEERLSGVELYQLLCSHGMETESYEHLTDLEKAAKAIVELNVFLASKVIFPAYMRYLEEDHPDVYTQYFERPGTPLPPDNIEAPSEKEMAHDQSFDTMASEGKKKRGVRFSVVSEVIPPSDLDELANMARHVELYDADDEDFDYLNLEDERSDNDSLLSIKDSLEMLTRLECGADQPVILNLLSQVIEAYNCGKLKENQVEKIADLAREILRSAISRSPSPIEVRDSLSFLAEQVVQEALDAISRKLIDGEPESEDSCSALASVLVNKSINMAAASLMAEQSKSPGRRSGPRPSSAPPTPDTGLGRPPAPGGTASDARSATSQLVWDVLNRVAKEVRSEIVRTHPKPGRGWRRNKKKLSESSLIVEEALQAAAAELTQMTALPSGNVDWSHGQPLKRTSSSVTGQFVRDTLASVIDDMVEEGVGARSSTSVFVESLIQETLFKTVQDVKTEQMEMEELRKLAVVIIQSHQSAQETGGKLKVPLKVPHCTRSQDVVSPTSKRPVCSAASFMIEALIRETLSKVRTAIQEGTMSDIELIRMAGQVKPSPGKRFGPQSATSTMAEDMVLQALRDVTQESSDLGRKAGAADPSVVSLEAETAVRKAIEEVLRKAQSDVLFTQPQYQPGKPKGSTSKPGFSSSVSVVAEAAVKDAIEQALKSNSKLSKLIGADVKSTTSVMAENAVREALERTIKSMRYDMKLDASQSLDKIRSVASLAAEAAVKEALEQALASEHRMHTAKPATSRTSDMSMVAAVAEEMVSNAIDTILEEISSHSKPSPAAPTSGTSVQAGSLVDSLLDSVLELIKQDSAAKKDSTPGIILSTAGGEDYEMLGAGPDVFHAEDCDSSEDEFPIHPVLNNEEIPVDHSEIEHALSILAIKKDVDFEHMNIDLEPTAPVSRNSFRDLFHPDVSKVHRLSSKNMAATTSKIHSMSTRCLFQQKSHMAPPQQRLTQSHYTSNSKGLLQKPEEPTDGETTEEEQELLTKPIHTDREFDEMVHYFSDEDASKKNTTKRGSNRSQAAQKKKSQELRRGPVAKTASPYDTKINKQRASNSSVRGKPSDSRNVGAKKPSTPVSSKTKFQPKRSHSKGSSGSLKQTPSRSKTGLTPGAKSQKSDESVVIEAKALVKNVMDTVLAQMNKDDLTPEAMKIVEQKVKASVENLIANAKSSGADVVEHHVHDADCDSSSEDEFPIHVMQDNKELHVDHHLVENALSIISVRRDDDLKHLDIDLDPLAPIARNSFRDVLHPDISKVSRLSAASEEGSCGKIKKFSSKCLTQRSCHMAPPSETDEETETLAPPKIEEVVTEGEEDETAFVPIHTDKEFDDTIHYYSDEEKKSSQTSMKKKKPARISRQDSQQKPKGSNTSVRKGTSGSNKPSPKASNTSRTSIEGKRSARGLQEKKHLSPSPHRGSKTSSTASVPNIQSSKEKSTTDGRSKSTISSQMKTEKDSQPITGTKKESQSCLLTEVAKKLESSSTQSATGSKPSAKVVSTPEVSMATVKAKPSNQNPAGAGGPGRSNRSSRNVSRRASRASTSFSPQASHHGSNNPSRNPSNNTSRVPSRNPSNTPSRNASKNPSRAPSQPPSKPPSRAASRQGAASPVKRSSHSFGRNSRTRVHGSPSPTPNSRNPSNKSIQPQPPKEEPVPAPREKVDSDDTEEIPEEIEAPQRRPWKRGSRSSGASLNKSSSGNPSQGSRHSHQASSSRDNVSQRGSQHTPRQSRQTVNIAPRPSSGYRKSPTPASVASGQALSYRGSGEKNNVSPTHSAHRGSQVRSDEGLARTSSDVGRKSSPQQSITSINSVGHNAAPQGEKASSKELPSAQHSSASLQ